MVARQTLDLLVGVQILPGEIKWIFFIHNFIRLDFYYLKLFGGFEPERCL